MIRTANISTPDQRGLLGCGVCPKECRLIDGAICRSGVRRRVGDRVIQLNYGMVSNLKVDLLPQGFLSGERGLYVSMLGGNHKLAFDPDWDLSQFYQERSKDIGKFDAMRYIETSGEYIDPSEIVMYAIQHEVDKILFFNGEPAVNLDYIFDISRSAREKGISVYIKSSGTISERYWSALSSDLTGVSLQFDSLDNSYNRKYFGISTDHLLRLIQNLSKTRKLHSIYTTILPEVDMRSHSCDKIMQFLNDEVIDNVVWIVRSFVPVYKMWDRHSIPVAELVEIVDELRSRCRVNIIADTGKIY